MSEYLVIGASGKTGQHAAAGLLMRGASVRAGSRTPQSLPEGPAKPVRFDWTDESSWSGALAGVEGVYLVKPETASVVDIVETFLGLAHDAQVKRLVLLSECAAQTRAEDTPERQVERLVEASPFHWTILRPSWMMQDITDAHFFGDLVRKFRMISMTTGGAATAWIDAFDIGDVAAQVLHGGRYSGQALDLTGPEGLTLDQLAAKISTHAGCNIDAVEESIEDAERRMREEGADEDFIAYITRISTSIMAGDTAEVTDTVRNVLGRAPRSVDTYLQENTNLLKPNEASA